MPQEAGFLTILILKMKKWRYKKFSGKSSAPAASKCLGLEPGILALRLSPRGLTDGSRHHSRYCRYSDTSVWALLALTSESLALLGAKHWLQLVGPFPGTWGNPGIGDKGYFSHKGAGCWPVCSDSDILAKRSSWRGFGAGP